LRGAAALFLRRRLVRNHKSNQKRGRDRIDFYKNTTENVPLRKFLTDNEVPSSFHRCKPLMRQEKMPATTRKAWQGSSTKRKKGGGIELNFEASAPKMCLYENL